MNIFACVEKNDAKILEKELPKVQDKDRFLRGAKASEMSDLFLFCVKKSSADCLNILVNFGCNGAKNDILNKNGKLASHFKLRALDNEVISLLSVICLN
jgi:hypothetical protein